MTMSNAATTANDITVRTQMLTEVLDEVTAQALATSAMTADPKLVRATDEAGVVKIGTVTTQGLGTYGRHDGNGKTVNSGYPMGDVTLTWQTYTLAYDRGRGFLLDSVDIKESGGIQNAAYTMAEAIRQTVVPEVDSLRLARAASAVIANAKATNVEFGVTLTAANVLSKIRAGLARIYEAMHIQGGCTIYAPYSLKSLLDASTEIDHVRNVDGTGRDVDMGIDAIDGNVIQYVPSAYLHTKFDLLDGKTSGQEAGGLTVANDALQVNFLIVAPGTAQGVVSVRSQKYIPAAINPNADADFIGLRIYHDCIVPVNKAVGIYASIKDADPDA